MREEKERTKESGGRGNGSGATTQLQSCLLPSLISPLNKSPCISSCCAPAFSSRNANTWAHFTGGHTQSKVNRNPSISTAAEASGSINRAGREWHKTSRASAGLWLLAGRPHGSHQVSRGQKKGHPPLQISPSAFYLLIPALVKHHSYLPRSEVS